MGLRDDPPQPLRPTQGRGQPHQGFAMRIVKLLGEGTTGRGAGLPRHYVI